ncbi:MAG: ribonuclease, partial [Candidatus Parcubacteria bacterium]
MARPEVFRSGEAKPPREVEQIRTPEPISRFIVGVVTEITEGGKTIKRLESRSPNPLRKRKFFSEQTLPILAGRMPGEILVLEKKPRAPDSSFQLVDELGKAGDLATARLELAYARGCGRVFPEAVRKEAAEIEARGEGMIGEEIERAAKLGAYTSAGESEWRKKYRHGESRIDFTDVTTVTIDPKTAKDFDDALSIRYVTETGGTWSSPKDGKKFAEVAVHIADATHFLPMQKGKLGNQIFEEAKRRQFTAYPEGDTFPMLPSVLSENLCSLKEGVKRL